MTALILLIFTVFVAPHLLYTLKNLLTILLKSSFCECKKLVIKQCKQIISLIILKRNKISWKISLCLPSFITRINHSFISKCSIISSTAELRVQFLCSQLLQLMQFFLEFQLPKMLLRFTWPRWKERYDESQGCSHNERA